MIYNITTAGVANRNGKFFIAKRKTGKSIGALWEFPGGKAKKNENPEDAIVREYLEEFNVKIKVLGKLCDGTFRNNKRFYQLIAFNINILDGNIDLTEHSEYLWVEKKDLLKYKFPKSDNIIISYLINNQ
jgi:mutator protein MutT